jgi:hypothetical protein
MCPTSVDQSHLVGCPNSARSDAPQPKTDEPSALHSGQTRIAPEVAPEAPPQPSCPAPSRATRRVRQLVKAPPELPQRDRTRAYDQQELSRLLVDTTDGAHSRGFSVHEAETMCPTAATRQPPVRGAANAISRHVRLPAAPAVSTRCSAADVEQRAPSTGSPLPVPSLVTTVESSPCEQARPRLVRPEPEGDAARHRDSRSFFLSLGMATLAGLALLVTVTNVRQRHSTPSISASAREFLRPSERTAPASDGQTIVAPSAASLAPLLIDIDIVVEPAHALLFLDGRTASNPLQVAYPADDATHELHAEAPNYRPITRSIKLKHSLRMILALERLSPSDQSGAR